MRHFLENVYTSSADFLQHFKEIKVLLLLFSKRLLQLCIQHKQKSQFSM